MKKAFLYFLPLLVSCSGSANENTNTATETSQEIHTVNTRQDVLRHVVLFKFKDSASEPDVSRIVEAFRALPQQIDGITDFEWGTDISPEGLGDGFTHCFFVTFKDEKSRDEYLPHPAHEAFGETVGPHLEKVLVVDYWARQ